ncbi:hypothetical protein [uncultured Chryseobacterium sp.]|uniref:hypothetical protein n=1 Tax=uncultured Chryseobacterium sp. TaxID=259322 RepID=UPI0025FC9AE4|nr:hypothetical protein [uncultured Chryseobacterium sp.]
MKTLYLSAVSKVRPGLPWNRQSIIISYSANPAGSVACRVFKEWHLFPLLIPNNRNAP